MLKIHFLECLRGVPYSRTKKIFDVMTRHSVEKWQPGVIYLVSIVFWVSTIRNLPCSQWIVRN